VPLSATRHATPTTTACMVCRTVYCCRGIQSLCAASATVSADAAGLVGVFAIAPQGELSWVGRLVPCCVCRAFGVCRCCAARWCVHSPVPCSGLRSIAMGGHAWLLLLLPLYVWLRTCMWSRARKHPAPLFTQYGAFSICCRCAAIWMSNLHKDRALRLCCCSCVDHHPSTPLQVAALSHDV
jgi:hypothetical protein